MDEIPLPSLEDLIAELTEYVHNIDRLPPHARTSPATNADLAYMGTMVLGIITEINGAWQTLDKHVTDLFCPDADA